MINLGADPKLTGALVYVAIVPDAEYQPIGVYSALDLAARAVKDHPRYVPGTAKILFHRIDGGPVIESL